MTDKCSLLIRDSPRGKCRIYLVDGAHPRVAHKAYHPVSSLVTTPVCIAVSDMVLDQLLSRRTGPGGWWPRGLL